MGANDDAIEFNHKPGQQLVLPIMLHLANSVMPLFFVRSPRQVATWANVSTSWSSAASPQKARIQVPPESDKAVIQDT